MRRSKHTPVGGNFGAFSKTVYADDYLLVKIQHSDDDRSALITSVSLASNQVRLFGPREDGVTPIQDPKARTDWNTTIDALVFTIIFHTLRSPCTREKIEAGKQFVIRSFACEQTTSRIQRGPQHGLRVVEPHVHSQSGQVFRVEALTTHRSARLAWPNTPEGHGEP